MTPLYDGDWAVTVSEYQAIAYSLSELTLINATPATNLPSISDVRTTAGANMVVKSGRFVQLDKRCESARPD